MRKAVFFICVIALCSCHRASESGGGGVVDNQRHLYWNGRYRILEQAGLYGMG
jgi:hypothetical protein